MSAKPFNTPCSLPAGLEFLAGGGEATRLILERDWSGHVLGQPDSWPEALKTALSLILNSPESMILSWGKDELTFFFNETYFPLLGPRLSWAMGAPFIEVWADAWAQAKPIIDDAFAGNSQHFTDLPWKLDTDRGAAETWWSFSYSRILDAKGEVAGLFIFTNETTARVQADAALRKETERQRISLQNMPAFVCILGGPEHVYEFVNESYRMMAGQRDFIGRTVRQNFPEVEGQGFFELLDEVYATGKPFNGRAMPIRFEGETEERFIDVHLHPIRSDGGEIVGIFNAGYDVSDRVRAEMRLAAVNETLEERIAVRSRELLQAEDALRQAQKMEAIGQLTGGIAHDFNNMLTGVIGSLDMLGRQMAEGRTDRAQRYIDVATTSAQRAAALTQRLLAFSRRQSLDVKPVDVNALVGGMEELLRRTLGEQVALDVRLHADAWAATTDQNQLESALLNLAINARDAMPQGGSLRVETANVTLAGRPGRGEPGGDFVVVSVCDTGTGMSPEVQARAFEPFYTTKPLGAGTGLGLSMIYGFMRQSGGEVEIESAVGRGTTIKLFLPRSAATARAEEVAAGAIHSAEDGEHILLVEDDAEVRLLLCDLLTDLGYKVVQAANGNDAVPLVAQLARLDLLITDVGLPGVNGRQVAEIARQHRPGLRILFITGYAEQAAVRSDFLDEGMEMITKPFAIDVLSAKIREMLSPR